MANKTQPNRTTKPQAYDFNGTCAAIYEPNGRSFTLALYPPLFDPFPAVEIRHELPAGLTAWTASPVVRAFRTIREREGNLNYILSIEFAGGILPVEGEPETYQTACYLVDKDGRILKQSYFNFSGDVSEALRCMDAEIDFEANAKPVAAGDLKTTINPPDLEQMLQDFVATIKAPGLPQYRYTGDAREVRKRKRNVDKYQHFTAAWVWKTGDFAHIIAQIDTGGWSIISHTPDGVLFMETTAKTRLGALRTAIGAATNYTPPKPEAPKPAAVEKIVVNANEVAWQL